VQNDGAKYSGHRHSQSTDKNRHEDDRHVITNHVSSIDRPKQVSDAEHHRRRSESGEKYVAYRSTQPGNPLLEKYALAQSNGDGPLAGDEPIPKHRGGKNRGSAANCGTGDGSRLMEVDRFSHNDYVSKASRRRRYNSIDSDDDGDRFIDGHCNRLCGRRPSREEHSCSHGRHDTCHCDKGKSGRWHRKHSTYSHSRSRSGSRHRRNDYHSSHHRHHCQH